MLIKITELSTICVYKIDQKMSSAYYFFTESNLHLFFVGPINKIIEKNIDPQQPKKGQPELSTSKMSLLSKAMSLEIPDVFFGYVILFKFQSLLL